MSAAARPSGRANLAGIATTLLGVFVFSFSNALAKQMMQTYPVGETLFVRSLVALLLLAPFIHRADLRHLWRSRRWSIHAIRCGFSAIEVGCYYWAVTGMQLADTTTIYLAGPIYVTAMSAIFLREQVGWRRWSAVLLGFVGVLIAIHPAGESLGPHAVVALAGSLLYAASLVAVRRLRDIANPILVASQVAALNLVTLTTIPFGWTLPPPADAAGLILIGVISTLGYICVNRGLQLAPASVVAPFQYVSIVFATLLGFLIFAEIPPPSTFLGAAVICAAGLFIVLRERLRETA